VAQIYIICSYHARRPVRKLLFTTTVYSTSNRELSIRGCPPAWGLGEVSHLIVKYQLVTKRNAGPRTSEQQKQLTMAMRLEHGGMLGKAEGKTPLGRPRRRWEDNTVQTVDCSICLRIETSGSLL